MEVEDIEPEPQTCVICQSPCVMPVRITDTCVHQGCLVCVEELRRMSWQLLRKGPPLADTICTDMQFRGACPLCRAGIAPPPFSLQFVDGQACVDDKINQKCPYCNHTCRTKGTLLAHLNKCRGKMPNCPYCNVKLECARYTIPSRALYIHVHTNQCTGVQCSRCFRRATLEAIRACERRHVIISEIKTNVASMVTALYADPTTTRQNIMPMLALLQRVEHDVQALNAVVTVARAPADSVEARVMREESVDESQQATALQQALLSFRAFLHHNQNQRGEPVVVPAVQPSDVHIAAADSGGIRSAWDLTDIASAWRNSVQN